MAAFNAGANCFLSSPYALKMIGPNPSTTRGVATHLNSHPRESKIIYPSGKFVIVKNIHDPSDCFIYRGHASPVTVAKFSPNGYWVASADTSGKLRVWSWDNPEHLLKLELPVFSGEVRDLDWDHESKKIVAVGDGSPLSVKVFTWDTGNSAGECVGHSKRVISCAYKPSRPFRVFTASEDMRTIFYAGPPFKLDHSNSCHSNFVNCIRYSSNGDRAVSVSSDKKIQFYDGKTGAENGDIVNAHGGSIYSVAFSADNNYVITTSADKTVKVWDVATLALVSTLSAVDPDVAQIPDMQVGVVSGGGLGPAIAISLSLSGNLNYYDISLGPGLPPALAPVRVVQGHQVALTALSVDRERGIVYTGSFDGVVCATDFSPSGGGIQTRLNTQERNTSVCGAVHGGMISGITLQRRGENEKEVVSIGWDDSIRRADAGTNTYIASAATSGQPCSISTCVGEGLDNIVAVATNSHVTIFRGDEAWITLTSLSYSPTAIAMWGGVEVAVGGSDNKTHIYAVDGDRLTPVTTIDTRSKVTAVSYNPQGDCLAIGDEGRQVEVYQRESWEPRVIGRWVFHSSRITCLSWSPSGAQLASGSLDENIFIWNLAAPTTKLQLPFCHMAGVTGVGWLDEERLVSGGNDHVIVLWKIPALSA